MGRGFTAVSKPHWHGWPDWHGRQDGTMMSGTGTGGMTGPKARLNHHRSLGPQWVPEHRQPVQPVHSQTTSAEGKRKAMSHTIGSDAVKYVRSRSVRRYVGF